jgi:signal transduction histidine kinase/ligand-binding sensor domain-containing protein
MNHIRADAKSCIISALMLLGAFSRLLAAALADSRPSGAELRFTHLGLSEGLTHADVRRAFRDSQGFMWFATWLDGVNRYDGYSFKPYRHDPKDERSLGFDNVHDVFEDSHHVLWIGTYGGGLDRYDRESDTFIHYRHRNGDPNSLMEDTIGLIYEDDTGELWIGTSGGVNRFDRKTQAFVNLPCDPNDPNASRGLVRGICRDRMTGLLWLGNTRTGITVMDVSTGTRTRLTHDPDDRESLSFDDVTQIYQDRAGDIWVGTEKGLNRWDRETKRFRRFLSSPTRAGDLGDDFIVAIHEDRFGRFWVGTMNGLALLDRASGKFSYFRHDPGNPNSLSGNQINIGGIFEDDTGALWISTHDNGVNRLDPNPAKFVTFRNDPANPNSLGQDTVTALFCDHAGILWIGTAAGLDRYDGHRFVHYVSDPQNPRSLSPGPVWAITESPDHQLWVAVNGGGLCRFDGANFTRYRHDPENPRSIGGDYIYGLQSTQHGGLWISIHGRGLDYFDGNEFSHFKTDPNDPNSLPDLYAGALFVDDHDSVWMSTPGMGLVQFDRATRKATTYLLDPSRPHNKVGNWVRDIDSDGKTIWAASYSGLFCFDIAAKKFTRWFTRQDGMASSSVLSVQHDAQGNVWVTTLAGISKLDGQRQTFRNYDVEDGLQSPHFCERSRARLPDGRVGFGGVAGFNLFDPEHLPDNLLPPPVVLTEFQLFNHPVPIGHDSPLQIAIHVADRVRLRYDQEVFRPKFAALDYTSPLRNRYAYKLEGFDREWRYTDASDRSATYTKLAAGNYVFRVKASNNDGMWNEAGTSILVTITPPWWRTWWFLSGAVASALAIAYGIYARRIQRIKAHNLRLEREVAARTIELTQKSATLESTNLELASKTSELRESQAALLNLVGDLNEKSHALESANKELEAFSYSVSHDLRAPLRSIDGFSQMILEDDGDKLGADTQENLRLIRAAAQRMGRLIDDMLRLSRVGRNQLVWTKIDLSAMVTHIADELRKSDPGRSVEFVIAPGCVIDGDAALLRIALENIVSNAWKYTGKTPNPRIEFGVASGKEGSVYFVRDNGCGFDMQYSQKLFGAFQRLHSPEQFPGSGIGLASVRRVFQRHDGTVWIEGEIDRGAVVYFSVPPRLKSP